MGRVMGIESTLAGGDAASLAFTVASTLVFQWLSPVARNAAQGSLQAQRTLPGACDAARALQGLVYRPAGRRRDGRVDGSRRGTGWVAEQVPE